MSSEHYNINTSDNKKSIFFKKNKITSSSSLNPETTPNNHSKRSYFSFTMKEHNLLSAIANAPHEPLTYAIYDQSSQSGTYHPRNICVNIPTDQSSRWSSSSHDQSQFITIKLDKPAVACKFNYS